MAEWLGILVFVVAILAVVLIHESGHFFTRRRSASRSRSSSSGSALDCGRRVDGETEYGVKAFPLGGYVRIAGMNPFQEPPAEERDRTFGAKPIWQRVLVILAGPATHFVMAVVFLFVFFAILGAPTPTKPLVGERPAHARGEAPPRRASRDCVGDQIVALDGHR